MRSIRPLLALGSLVSAVTSAGCAVHGSGPVTTQTRQPQVIATTPGATGTFSRLDLRGPVDVIVREGATTAVSVTGNADVQARVQTRVEGDTLVVDLGPALPHLGLLVSIEEGNAKVTVDLPALRAATIEGSGDLTVVAQGSHPEVEFSVEGSGDVRYSGNADLLRCSIGGSGDVILHGVGKRLEASIHGSGDLEGREFQVEGGSYEIEGSGDIATAVHGGDMAVRLNGSGDFLYEGEARITSLEVSGSGSVRQVRSGGD